MSIGLSLTRANRGLEATLVRVETQISPGLPGFSIVGLPETCVKESRYRVRCAITESSFDFMARKITVNLAPADIPKQGGRFDLAIALSVLAATGQIKANALADVECIGELGLSGELRPVRGCLPVILAAKKAKRSVILPQANAQEASLINYEHMYAADTLDAVCHYLNGHKALSSIPHSTREPQTLTDTIDFKTVIGQRHAKRALEIAAAGNHHVLMSGPPGTGKSLLAHCFASILPPMSEQEAIEATAIRSLCRSFQRQKHPLTKRPFRSPHHTASTAALIGGSNPPQPGEISLAHLGVLFLDELPEFKRSTLESLREPLETGQVIISRSGYQSQFPARFQLVAAMNPCPCGYLGDTQRHCQCPATAIQRYQHKISGPLRDRFDIQLSVERLPATQSWDSESSEDSGQIRARVVAAQRRQFKRQKTLNARLSGTTLTSVCALKQKDQNLLQKSMQHYALSMRAAHRTLRVARTIADLDAEISVTSCHLQEALLLRQPEPSTPISS